MLSYLAGRIHPQHASQTSSSPRKSAHAVSALPSLGRWEEPLSLACVLQSQAQHLNRHSLVHASLAARSFQAFGGVAPLGGNRSSLGWPTQLVEVQRRAGGWHFEVQALIEVSLGCHLLGGLIQEVVGRWPPPLVHLPAVGRIRSSCETSSMVTPMKGKPGQREVGYEEGSGILQDRAKGLRRSDCI